MQTGKAKTGVVAIFNREGKLVGYNVHKINRPLLEGADVAMAVNLAFHIKDGIRPEKNPKAYNELITKNLKDFGIDLKQRFVPMSGYRFNEKRGKFFKIRKRKSKKKETYPRSSKPSSKRNKHRQ